MTDIILTEAQERALRMAAANPYHIIVGGKAWGNNTVPYRVLRDLRDMGFLWSHRDARDTGRITERGLVVLQELDGMGGGTPDPLDEQVHFLADCRKAVQQAKEQYQALLDQHPEIADALGWVKTCQDAERETYERVCELATAAYEQTGDKQPHPHVKVIDKKKVKYDPATALKYAQNTGLYLIFDARSFESDMTKIKHVPDFVTVYTEPKAKIDSQLED